MQPAGDTTMDDLYTQLAGILELEQVTPGIVLAECEFWDSLTVLSIISMLDANYGVHLSAGEVRAMHSAADLASAVEQRRRP
jgi:acyl carrier protein